MKKQGINTLVLLLFLSSLSFAQKTEDPFLWLEKVEGQRALKWVHAQNKSTENELKKNPEFQKIYEKDLTIYNSKARIANPVFHGKYIYNFWQDAKNVRGLWRRTTLSEYLKAHPKWETVLSIDSLNKAEGETWVYKGSNFLRPGYNRCMISLSRGGGDAVVIREFDLRKKRFVKDGFYLKEAKGSVSWKDQNTLLVSTNFGKGTTSSSGYPLINKIWKRGTDLGKAPVLFKGDSTDMGVWSYVIYTPERSFQIIEENMTFYTHRIYVVEKGKRIRLDLPEDADLSGIFKNQMLIQLKTDWTVAGKTYRQGALLSIDYDHFLQGDRDFTTVFQPDNRSSIVTVSHTKNYLLVNILRNVRSELYRFTFDKGQWKQSRVPVPKFGSIYLGSADQQSDRYFFYYTNFLMPSTLYLASAIDNRLDKLKSMPAFFDSSPLTVEQFEAVSKDGTPIPYFVVHQKEMTYNGTNPTLLYGYGGFEISLRPSYSPTVGSNWLERGGVYVLANIRGGGEFGPKWHLAALKEHRQRAYDDFIAVAEDLISRKITSPGHLGIMGGSNGGLLVGVAFTERPDLFNAVVCRVPLLDMKRYNKLLAGASWMGEYGNPDKPEDWAYIKKYSPYQNVFKNKKYPKVFFITSTRDDRVHPGHARKMAAKMEALGYPVYYYENTEGGHAAATTNRQRAYANALIYTYLLNRLF